MKIKREVYLVTTVLIFAMLACNLPGASSLHPDSSPTLPVPTQTATIEQVEFTATPAPTVTPIPPSATRQAPAELTLTKNSNCRLGPGSFYNVVDQISANKVLMVIGRNEENTWWQVVNATGRECWIFNENAMPNSDFNALEIGSAPALPGTPLNFVVVNQDCQPGLKKFSVTLGWSSGGGETAFRLYRDSKQIIELKAGKNNFKDARAPLNRNITYELEAVNGNGTSQKAVQIVSACK